MTQPENNEEAAATAAKLMTESQRWIVLQDRARIPGLGSAQAFSLPLCDIFERNPHRPTLWRLSSFGLAVREHLRNQP